MNHHASGNGDRHDSLAKKITEHGIEVIIIASSFMHSEHRYLYDDVYYVQELDKLKYIWLHTKPPYKGNDINRLLNMISYMRLIKKYANNWWEEFGKPDVVIGSSVHPFAWEAAYWISKKVGADFYAEVRDLWPLSLIEVQQLNPNHPLVQFFGILEKRAYRRAKKIITTMPYAYIYISETLGFPRDKVVWIPNGIDTERVDNVLKDSDIKLPDELNLYLESNWCAVYAGSLVKSECVDYILEVAEQLQKKGNNKIKFAIVGNGHQKKDLMKIAKEKKLNNVRFFNRVSKEQTSIVVSKAKVCLGAVRNLPIYKYGLSMNKLNDYLYSGNPTIFVCDVENVVRLSGGGISIPYGNIELFVDAIERIYSMNESERKLMAKRGRETIKEQYDTKKLANELLSILNGPNKTE